MDADPHQGRLGRRLFPGGVMGRPVHERPNVDTGGAFLEGYSVGLLGPFFEEPIFPGSSEDRDPPEVGALLLIHKDDQLVSRDRDVAGLDLLFDPG